MTQTAVALCRTRLLTDQRNSALRFAEAPGAHTLPGPAQATPYRLKPAEWACRWRGGVQDRLKTRWLLGHAAPDIADRLTASVL